MANFIRFMLLKYDLRSKSAQRDLYIQQKSELASYEIPIFVCDIFYNDLSSNF